MNSKENKYFFKSHLIEYQIIQQWRNSLVGNNYLMTSIFLPLSFVFFSTYFLIPPRKDLLWIIFLAISYGLIVFWRYYAYRIDKKIIEVYPRICELEEEFHFSFTREYIKKEFFPKKPESWLPKRTDVEKKIGELYKPYKFYKFKIFTKIAWSRGHGKLNYLAVCIILVEGLVLYLYQPK